MKYAVFFFALIVADALRFFLLLLQSFLGGVLIVINLPIVVVVIIFLFIHITLLKYRACTQQHALTHT